MLRSGFRGSAAGGLAPQPAAAFVVAVLLTSCSLATEDNGADDTAPGECGEVVLVTHDSFDLPKKVVKAFEEESGCRLTHAPAGDGGELTSKLTVTEGDPIGDVAFGVDNTFAGAALEEGVFAPYDADLPPGADDYRLPGDDDHALTPIDNASVCVNSTSRGSPTTTSRRRPTSTTWSTRPTATSSSRRRRRPARPDSRSCSRPSVRTATTGRRTGRTCSPTVRRS